MIYDPKSGTYFDPKDAALSYAFAGPGGAVSTITVQYNGGTWIKTFTYTGAVLASESVWVKQ